MDIITEKLLKRQSELIITVTLFCMSSSDLSSVCYLQMA